MEADQPLPASDSLPEAENEIRLVSGEQVLVGPLSASFARVDSHGRASPTERGRLVVTDRRLILLASKRSAIDLRRITELGLMANHVLVTISRSRGLIIEIDGAQQLRREIAGAVSARRERSSDLVPVMASGLGSVADAELVEDVADVPADRSR